MTEDKERREGGPLLSSPRPNDHLHKKILLRFRNRTRGRKREGKEKKKRMRLEKGIIEGQAAVKNGPRAKCRERAMGKRVEDRANTREKGGRESLGARGQGRHILLLKRHAG